MVSNTPGAVRNREASVNDVNLIVGRSDACLMRFDDVEVMAVGNLFLLILGSPAAFFCTVSSSPEALGTGVVEDLR
jgi:hypothetical protein